MIGKVYGYGEQVPTAIHTNSSVAHGDHIAARRGEHLEQLFRKLNLRKQP